MSDDSPAARIGEAYEGCLEAIEALSGAQRSGGIDQKSQLTERQAALRYHEYLALTLRRLNAPENWNPDGVPKVYVPRLIVQALEDLVNELQSGRMPSSVQNLFFSRGRPGVSATQRRAIESAVRYLVAIEDGFIPDDADAHRTVASAFGVEQRTVWRWIREHGGEVKLRIDRSQALPSERLGAVLLQHVMDEAEIYRAHRHKKRQH